MEAKLQEKNLSHKMSSSFEEQTFNEGKMPSTYTTKISTSSLCFSPKCWMIELFLTSSWIWTLVCDLLIPSFIPNLIVWIKVGGIVDCFYETGFRRFYKIFFWQGNFFFVFFVKKIQITMFSQFMSLPLTKAKNGGPTQLGIEILPGQWGGALKRPNSFFLLGF
jgi:hypothetical protein